MENIISNERKNFHLLVKNDFNTICFKKTKPREIDLFLFYLISLNENKLKNVSIKFDEIKKVLEIKRRHNETINNLIWKSHDNLLSLNFWISVNGKKMGRHILDRIDIDEINKVVNVSLHKDFKPILTNIDTGNFTPINFLEVKSLKNGYSKKLYSILKQQENKGKVYSRKIENWKQLLEISKDRKFKEINQTILEPAIKELRKYFKNLVLVTNKDKKIITHFGFNFTPVKKQYNKKNIENKKNNHKVDFEEDFNDYSNYDNKNIELKPLSKEEKEKILLDFDNY